jgi:Protein of unknown function (DUF1501)
MFSFFDSDKNGTRREFMKVGGLAGLSLPMLLQAKAAGADARRPLTTGKSVIFLMMQGGPSQIETWDPKPAAPSNNRSATGAIQTRVPGLQFGGTFTKLAQHADKLAIVRNYQVENGNHDIKPVVSPHSLGANLGSLFSRVAGTLRPNGMPTNVAIFPNSVDSRGPGARTNFGNFMSTGSLGAGYSPFVPGAGGQMQQNMTLTLDRNRLDDRRALLSQIDRLHRQIDASGGIAAVDRFHEQAFDVITSGIARAFDLSRENPRVVDMYDTQRYERPDSWAHKNNRNSYLAHSRTLGKLLLLARRLCEAGAGFVLVNTEFVWDMHQDVNNLGCREGMELVGRPFDHAVSALISDLEVRGLSDDILLVATGEMGRTPGLQNNGGRNHWGKSAPLLLHGGGITHGQVIGQSSRDGGEPAGNPQRIPNLIATIMNALFHTGDVRVASGVPTDVNRVLTEVQPIPGLFS